MNLVGRIALTRIVQSCSRYLLVLEVLEGLEVLEVLLEVLVRIIIETVWLVLRIDSPLIGERWRWLVLVISLLRLELRSHHNWLGWQSWIAGQI